MKKVNARAIPEDLQLLALLVAKRLRSEHAGASAPGVGDYRIADSKAFVQAGSEVQVDIDLGRGVKVQFYDAWWDSDLDWLLRMSSGIAEKIDRTVRHADGIRAMVAEVTAAARREIAKARRRGLSFSLTSVTLPPLEAGQHDEAIVRVEHLAYGKSLQLEPSAFHAACAEDVVSAFAGIVGEQGRRRDQRAWFDHIGATGRIDSVLVAALGAAGLDLTHVLTTMRDAEEWIVDFNIADGKRMTLHWDEGTVRAQVGLGEGVSWQKGRLSFDKSERRLRKVRKGSPLSKVFDHPFLNDRICVSGDYKTEGQYLSVNCNEAMMHFDADSGRLWAA